jgi:inner membrane protein
MPTIFTHALAGATVARVGASGAPRKALTFAAAFVAMLPDADVVTLDWDIPYQSMFGHRGLTHSLAFAAAIGLAGAATSRAASRLRTGVCLALATASHGLLDALTDGGRGVALLAPFTSERFFFPFRPIAVSPIGFRFFSERGMAVLASEMLWVWIPLLAVSGAVAAWRRARPS